MLLLPSDAYAQTDMPLCPNLLEDKVASAFHLTLELKTDHLTLPRDTLLLNKVYAIVCMVV